VNAIVIAKEPVPGRVKTRLCPPCAPSEAAAIAEAALVDTLDAVRGGPFTDRVVALDGHAGAWLGSGFDVMPQRGDGLDERLAHAFADVAGPAIAIGMDTPQVRERDLAVGAGAVLRDDVDAALGLAEDGGWWTIALRHADPRVFVGVPMSSPMTGASQLARLASLGMRVAMVPTFRDVDTFDDACAVAALAPVGRFAAAVTRVRERIRKEVPA
jgi:glycosyltransferase A (GT-A) superfamily protein (DUF2064 family)